MQTKRIEIEEKILKTAKKVFLEKGMAGARMQDIANRANINKSLIHYYFKDKHSLFKLVFNQVFSIIAPQINEIINDNSSIEDKIRRITCNYFDFRQEHPHLSNFVINELNVNPDFFETLTCHPLFPNIDKFKEQVRREVNQGILVPIDGEQLFIHIISLNIFPFMAAPLIQRFMDSDNKHYQAILKCRKTEVADFIINSITRKT